MLARGAGAAEHQIVEARDGVRFDADPVGPVLEIVDPVVRRGAPDEVESIRSRVAV